MSRGEKVYSKELDSKARYFVSLGCTNAMVAMQLGVSSVCLYQWKNKHESFKRALHAGMVDNLETGYNKKDAEEMLIANGMWKGSE